MPLTSVGLEQARLLGAWLADHRWLDSKSRLVVTSLVSSPLRRARETSAQVATGLGLAVALDPALVEASFRVADHLPRRDGPFANTAEHRPSEPYRAYKAQAAEAFAGLVERTAEGAPVLAVTHGGLIKTMLRLVLGTDAVCFRLYNASISAIEWREGRWNLIHLNLWDHLAPSLRTE